MKKISFFLFLSTFCLFGQENKNALVWFDSVVSQKNLDINFSHKYINKFRSVRDYHQFLLENKFYNSSITYDDQNYYNIPIKYDINEDIIIAKIGSKSTSQSIILIKAKIQSFTINNFISFHNIKGNFYEKIYQSKKGILLKKYHKKRSKVPIKGIFFDKFKEDNSFYLLINNMIHKIEKKKDWQKLFPKKKKEIIKFYQNNKWVLKKSKLGFNLALSKIILQ